MYRLEFKLELFMSKLSVVGVSGSLKRPSRTSALVSAILKQIALHRDVETQLIDLNQIGSGLFASDFFDHPSEDLQAVIDAIEAADILVVGSPVYRGSYSGAFKHLFDLVRFDRLKGKTVVLTATGGSPLHGLVTEHQFRPLFGFFGALTLPTTIYALEADFTDYRISNPTIHQRVEAVAREALHAIAPRKPSAVPVHSLSAIPLNA
jgi:FMN reductase